MEKVFQTADQVTEDMKKEWAEKFHTKVRTITVPIFDDYTDTGKKAKFFLKKPDRTVIDQITKASSDQDYEKCHAITLANGVLGGDMVYLQREEDGGNDKVFWAVLDAIGELVEKKKAIFLD